MFDWQTFHFLRPMWLFALLPLAGLIYFYSRGNTHSSAWNKLCDPHLLSHLLINKPQPGSRLPLWMLTIAWLLTILALAGPTWSKLEQPLYRSDTALVVLLDLSKSMDATDIQPSRLDLAKFKLIDLFKQHKEGKSALIVYAANPFIVSPLTDDADTIIAQIPALSTALVPRQGSRADLAMKKAAELMKQAGSPQGHILLITDGINDDSLSIAKALNSLGINISVFAVGTHSGAPIPVQNGGFLKDRDGAIVIPQLDRDSLMKLANAGGGLYQTMTASPRDIQRLTAYFSADSQLDQADKQKQTSDSWREQGPWLVLLILPFAALAFRRGWLTVLFLAMFIPPQPSYAFGWLDLWQTPNQQAAAALKNNDPEKAATLFTDPRWQGIAQYKKGDYEQAAQTFSRFDDAESHYNRANALAKAGKLQEAIQAYDEALKKQPQHEDAQFNRKLVESLLRQQEAAQEQKNSQQTDEQNEQDEQDEQDTQENGSQSPNQPQQQENQQQGASNQNDPLQNQHQNNQQENTSQDDKSPNPQENELNQDEKAQNEQEPAEQGAEERANTSQDENLSEIDKETQQAVEQWLRRIPDDPGGLLRRKFIREHQKQRMNPSTDLNEQPW